MPTDTLQACLSTPSDNVANDIDVILGANGNAFWISLAILAVIYLFKYWIGKECESKDFIEILLEIPIDIITILITIIITVFCVKDRMHYGHYLFLSSLVVAGICTLVRRRALTLYYKNTSKGKVIFGWLIFELAIGVCWICFVYSKIS